MTVPVWLECHGTPSRAGIVQGARNRALKERTGEGRLLVKARSSYARPGRIDAAPLSDPCTYTRRCTLMGSLLFSSFLSLESSQYSSFWFECLLRETPFSRAVTVGRFGDLGEASSLSRLQRFVG